MPVSSLTCTRATPETSAAASEASSTVRSRHTTMSACQLDRPLDLGAVGERAHDQDRRFDAAVAQLGRLLDRGHRQPCGAGAQGGAGALDGAVAVAVGLDDRAQSAAAVAARGAGGRSCVRRASPRIDALRGAPAATLMSSRLPVRAGSAAITSVAITPSARALRARRQTAGPDVQQHTGRGRRERLKALGEQRGDDAAEHVPAAGGRQRGTVAGADGDQAGGIGDERVVALEHDHGTGSLRGQADVRQAFARDVVGVGVEQPRQLARMRGEHGRRVRAAPDRRDGRRHGRPSCRRARSDRRRRARAEPRRDGPAHARMRPHARRARARARARARRRVARPRARPLHPRVSARRRSRAGRGSSARAGRRSRRSPAARPGRTP